MKSVGIFEAKTKLSGLCEEVASTGRPLLVNKRGKPLVMISPLPKKDSETFPDPLSSWQQWTGPPDGEADFPEVWKERTRSEIRLFEDDDLAP